MYSYEVTVRYSRWNDDMHDRETLTATVKSTDLLAAILCLRQLRDEYCTLEAQFYSANHMRQLGLECDYPEGDPDLRFEEGTIKASHFIGSYGGDEQIGYILNRRAYGRYMDIEQAFCCEVRAALEEFGYYH